VLATTFVYHKGWGQDPENSPRSNLWVQKRRCTSLSNFKNYYEIDDNVSPTEL